MRKEERISSSYLCTSFLFKILAPQILAAFIALHSLFVSYLAFQCSPWEDRSDTSLSVTSQKHESKWIIFKSINLDLPIYIPCDSYSYRIMLWSYKQNLDCLKTWVLYSDKKISQNKNDHIVNFNVWATASLSKLIFTEVVLASLTLE